MLSVQCYHLMRLSNSSRGVVDFQTFFHFAFHKMTKFPSGLFNGLISYKLSGTKHFFAVGLELSKSIFNYSCNKLSLIKNKICNQVRNLLWISWSIFPFSVTNFPNLTSVKEIKYNKTLLVVKIWGPWYHHATPYIWDDDLPIIDENIIFISVTCSFFNNNP